MVSPLAGLKSGVLRPRDAAAYYTQPAHQFQYWAQEGVLLKVAHGYYVHIPEVHRGQYWRPEMEALALGIGALTINESKLEIIRILAVADIFDFIVGLKYGRVGVPVGGKT